MVDRQETYQVLKQAYMGSNDKPSAWANKLLELTANFLYHLEVKNKPAVIECFHQDISFQQPPLPRFNGIKSVSVVVGAIFKLLTVWRIEEIRSVSISHNTVVIERVEVFGLLGIELILPGPMVLEFEGDKIIRITDYVDFLTCIAQCFIAPWRMLINKLFR